MQLETLEKQVAHLLEPHTSFLMKRLKKHHAPTYKQSLQAAWYAEYLGHTLAYTEEELVVLCRTALLQDIGKLRVQPAVLDCQDRLNGSEFWALQEHPKVSAEILEPYTASVEVDAEALLYHHENLDGTGYPFGKTWKELSLNARILRIASACSSMASTGMACGDMLEELYCWSDILFDADLVERLTLLLREQEETNRVKGDGRYGSLAERNRKP